MIVRFRVNYLKGNGNIVSAYDLLSSFGYVVGVYTVIEALLKVV